MKILLTFLFLTSQLAIADKLPDSLLLWKDAASYFRSLDYSDEPKFKEQLKSYYTKVYDKDRYQAMAMWIEKGSIESEYYAEVYGELQDTTIKSIKHHGKNTFKVKAVRNSCYNLDYNPLIMESIKKTIR